MRALAVLVAALAAAPARAQDCALALALALDISSSVNSREYEIQKGGLAAALRDPEIRAAALSGAGPVWLAAYEWSGVDRQILIAPWVRIGAEADLDRFATRLDVHQRSNVTFGTAIGAALEYGVDLLGAGPTVCDRRVIDISGDGVNNDGFPPDALPPTGLLAGITINALVIKGAVPDPEPHYRAQVIHGPDSFMLVARNGFDDYADLIKGKLLRELKPPFLIGALE